jgi:hypothetical protein
MLQPLVRKRVAAPAFAAIAPNPRHDAPRPAPGDNSWFGSSLDLHCGLTVIEEGHDIELWFDLAFRPAARDDVSAVQARR